MAGIMILPKDTTIVVATRFLHYLYPTGLFVWFVAAQTVSLCTLANLRAPSRKARKWLFVWMQLLLLVSYTIEACLLIVRSLVQRGWWSSQDNVIYLLSSIIVWGVIEVAIFDTPNPVWYPYYGAWVFAFCTEVGILILSAESSDTSVIFDFLKIGVQWCRILAIVVMPALVWTLHSKGFQTSNEDGENSGLLDQEQRNNVNYGATDSDSENGVEAQATQAKMREKLEKSGNWWTYAKSFTILWKYIWPSSDRKLQFSMFLVGCCIVAQRGLNVMVPHQLGVVTNALSKGGSAPWLEVCLFVLYRWLDSGSGISALQSYLWMPIEQYSYRSITTAAYNHVMSLSYDFHSNKKTGELWMSISQGRSINGLIDIILFAILPMLADLCIAFTYFFVLFNAYMALIVAVVSITYLWGTAKLSAMRNKIRRDLNQTARDETNIMVETVSSWTTVSYFNRVPYEQERYYEAIKKYQGAERRWQIGISIVNVVQSLIFTVGLLAASFLAVYEVTMGRAPVGSFVSLLSYWAQLSGPLSFFANLFRRVQNQMLDAERMLELFQTEPSVTDKSGALELKSVDGAISFNNVGFSYDVRKPTVKNLSFSTPPGSTVALVGETGGGKTTCLKLLFRFYDVETGSITVDGHDIRNIKVKSLRDFMGVVPQDPHLFNDTIISNIKYANFDVTDEDVFDACRAASIHDKILSFPDGYLSKVGEHGVRLSGGELQRVAIARAILRNPRIILLDEATSMVDMETERQIQSALQRLSKNRTVIVVAHRLSTIMNADLILVIGDGTIIEKGNHQELITAQGKYFQLWSKQLKNEASKSEGITSNDLIPDDCNNDPENSNGGFRWSNPQDSSECGDTLVPKKQSDPAIGSIQPQFQSGGDSQQIVTFSLPNRSSDATQLHRHNLMNPRLTVPQYGILKGFSHPQGVSEDEAAQSSPRKSTSALKPDAIEFIPKGAGLHESSASLKKEPASPYYKGLPVEAVEPSNPSLKQELIPELLLDSTRASISLESNQKIINPTNENKVASSTRLESEDQEMTEHQAAEKRRRHRTRRRISSLSQQATENSNTSQINNSTEPSNVEVAPPVTSIPVTAVETNSGNEPESEIDRNPNIKKPRRRFRSASRVNLNKVESENDDPNSAKHKDINNFSKQQGGKCRSKSFRGQRPKFNSNDEDAHNPKNGQSSEKTGNSIPASGSDVRAKNSGKSGSYSKGSWRKDKVPKTKDSGNNIASS